MEKSIDTTTINSTNSHIPDVYQVSPDKPILVVETPSIHTMKTDIADAIKNQNESLVSIAMAENKKKERAREVEAIAREKEESAVSVAPRKINRIVIIVVLVLVLAGAVLAYKFILPKLPKINTFKISIPSFGSPSTESRPDTQTAPLVDLAPSLIKATTEKRFDVSKETTERMFGAIAGDRTAIGTQGDIKNFYFYEYISTPDGIKNTVSISANRLITLTGISTPEILIRSLKNTFMVGLLNEETDSFGTPFIILKVSGYDTGLAGMLEWERRLPRFFDIIFGTNIEAGLSDKTKMRDIVLSSRDARVLEITPTIGIAYSFANPSTIVITSSRNALEKLVSMIAK